MGDPVWEGAGERRDLRQVLVAGGDHDGAGQNGTPPVARAYPSPAGASRATGIPSRTGQPAASFSSRWTTSTPVA
jgi:hypothetical protein